MENEEAGIYSPEHEQQLISPEEVEEHQNPPVFLLQNPYKRIQEWELRRSKIALPVQN